MRQKRYISHRRPTEAREPAHKRILARTFAVRRHVVENFRKLRQKRVFVAQTGDCACAFEEPLAGKP